MLTTHVTFSFYEIQETFDSLFFQETYGLVSLFYLVAFFSAKNKMFNLCANKMLITYLINAYHTCKPFFLGDT